MALTAPELISRRSCTLVTYSAYKNYIQWFSVQKDQVLLGDGYGQVYHHLQNRKTVRFLVMIALFMS